MVNLLLSLAVIAAIFPAIAQAQGTLAPTPQIVFLDGSGNPINNGKICTYAAGTSTPLATYSDSTLMTANANPIRTNSAGRPTTGGIYLSPTSYKFIVLTAGTDNTCSTGTTIYTQDAVSAVPATSTALDVTGTAGEALVLGDVLYLADGTVGTAGRWYKADADATTTSSTPGMVGVATAAIASGDSGSIRVSGRLTGLSALTAGELYYASSTAGALTATPPTNARFVGQADSTTSLVIGPNPGGLCLPDSDGTHKLCERTSSNLTADRLLTWVTGDAARTITLSGDTSLNQSLLTTAGPTFAGATLSADLVFSADMVIRRNTSDASDNGAIAIAGGGAAGITRGANLTVYGNEGAAPGSFLLDLGNVANANFRIRDHNNTAALEVDEDDDQITAPGVYALTDGGAANVIVLADGKIKRATSSARYKKNILAAPDWRWLLNLTPQISERYDGAPGRQYPSFIAEDVAAIGPKDQLGVPLFAELDTLGRPDAVSYPHFVMPLTAAVQEHEQRLQQQLDLINGLLMRLSALEAEVAALKNAKP